MAGTALTHARRTLAPEQWRPLAREHASRAERLTPAPDRRDAVTGFLFTYYSLRPRQLRRWHPGVGTALAGADEHRRYRWYATEGDRTAVDVAAVAADRASAVRHYERLLSAVRGRAARHDCFGMHEWAMVYRARQTRHAIPLRLGARATDQVVESLPLRCTHYDAYRFFTDEARPRNARPLERAGQVDHDQPGCVHVTMDLYQAASKLGPLVPGDLLLDCLELATRARVVDMRASPYDLRALGHEPIRVETADGRAQYAAAQRSLAAAATPLRQRLLDVTRGVLATVAHAEDAHPHDAHPDGTGATT